MIRVLGLALYGPLAASTRYRLGQYVPGLAQQGIDLEIRHLLGDEYLTRRFADQRAPWAYLIKAGLKRALDLGSRARFDLAMLHCELYPLLPGGLERALLPRRYIYDFDDAFYLKYRDGRFGLTRPLLGHKFDLIMQRASAITAGNSVLAEYASQHNAATRILPTVVDTNRYVPQTRSAQQPLTVGWIGSPSTAPYLAELAQPMAQLATEGPVRLVVIGGKAPRMQGVTIDEVPWSEATEVSLINSFDVGVMPLPDDAWARGKCAFKLIQYMACGVPVIASRVGANVDVVTPECGFLAGNDLEWLSALRALRDDPALRVRMGDASRARIEGHYSLRRNLPILVETIHDVAKRT